MQSNAGVKPVRKQNLSWGKKGRQERAGFLVVIKHEEVTWKILYSVYGKTAILQRKKMRRKKVCKVCGKARARSLNSGSSL